MTSKTTSSACVAAHRFGLPAGYLVSGLHFVFLAASMGWFLQGLRAPIDGFFDVHPIGRVVNCMSADLAIVDLFLLMKSMGTIALLCQTLVQLLYVHTTLPWIITLALVPSYWVGWRLCRHHWRVTASLRSCGASSRAVVNSLISDAMNNCVVARAYGDQEGMYLQTCRAVDDQLKAGITCDRTLHKWLVNRILLIWSFFPATMYLVAILNPLQMGAGTLGLCLTNLLLLEALMETHFDSASAAQAEFVALAQLHDYLFVPQEKPLRHPGDAAYRSFALRIPRGELG
eukprot:CAMPEP_0168365838 /NCGR_PEP_ID=MMETSP0228-20121227/4922_1 /TAXON_ID=133427 /ORGANISM="Protoceratium reticulatum, Strain CCCM 535 (=CCMP 1889)" /LENGTH=286 /DNA_ID=CAMNT_0008378627 /DNA_START=155 /DNA_END=1012 /DNA_ORIENTATION=+